MLTKGVTMPRISIEVDAQQHQQIKAMALLSGQNIKDYVLSRTIADLPDPASMSDQEALQALKQILAPRIQAAESGQFSTRDANGIIAEAKRRKSER
jgi:hypothetical protein